MTLLNGDQGQRTSHAHVIKRQTASTSARQNVILDKRARDKIVLVFIQVVFQHPLDFQPSQFKRAGTDTIKYLHFFSFKEMPLFK